MGYSFGGYHAPRVAAFEKRYAAAVAFGAMHWNIYDWVAGNKAKLAADPRTSSTSIFQFRWVVGAPERDRARMGEEVHARRRRTADRMRVSRPARRERPDRAARGSQETLRAGRLETK